MKKSKQKKYLIKTEWLRGNMSARCLMRKREMKTVFDSKIKSNISNRISGEIKFIHIQMHLHTNLVLFYSSHSEQYAKKNNTL